MTAGLTEAGITTALRDVLRPGMTVALGDGVGALRCLDDGASVGAALSAAAREVGSVRLVLGWLPAPVDGLDPDAFADVVALMPGWGVREVLQSPKARFLPTRLAAIPALLTDVLRPDVLLTRLVTRDGLLRFGTEVSWQRAVIAGGTKTLAVIDTSAPSADAGPALDPSRVEALGTVGSGPVRVPQRDPEPIHDTLADAVLQLIPQGARIQYGPGQLGTALLRRAQVPLHIDTGLLTDAVVDLDQRGLLAGTPSATYLLGSDSLYDWADGRPILHGLDYTHDLTRLSRGAPLVAVNTAIEIDQYGQINVEGFSDKVIGGLSIIAVPTRVNGRSPLVEQLSRPVSTPAHDVDVIVTESGHVDLRAADWSQRRALITELFTE
jgi:acyl-CoA hydrolase